MVTDRCRTIFAALTIPLEEDGDLVCQAGASWDEINRILEERDIPLFFPVCDISWAVPDGCNIDRQSLVIVAGSGAGFRMDILSSLLAIFESRL